MKEELHICEYDTPGEYDSNQYSPTDNKFFNFFYCYADLSNSYPDSFFFILLTP